MFWRGQALRGSALSIALCALLGACSANNPLYCDEQTACQDLELNFCDVSNMYASSSLANECISRPETDACNRVERCPQDAEKKHCTDVDMGICVACISSAHCTGPDFPYCGQASTCVGCLVDAHCTTNAAEAVCDQQSFSCRGCIDNAECDSRLCGDGVCADKDDILYVDETTGADSVGCGDYMSPCASIGQALGEVTDERDTLLIAEGTYLEKVVIANLSVSLRGEGRVILQANLAESEHVLAVSGQSEVDVQGIEIRMLTAPQNADAVSCTESTASLVLRNVVVKEAVNTGVVGHSCAISLFGSSINDSGGRGVEMRDGTLEVHGSIVQFNAGGGIEIVGSNYSLVNNIVNNNGSPGGVFGGVRIEDTATRSEEFLFNTVAQNSRASGSTTGSALRCETSALLASSNIFMLEDSSTAVLVTGCATEFSLFDTAVVMPPGNGNISAEALFVSPTARNFHLQAGSPGIDAAQPGTGIVVDIDGQERTAGAGPDMGADETP